MEFFYDLSCPFAYAASVIIKNHKLVVTARPVLLGALYEATNAPQGKAGSASDVMAPSKRALFSADMLRTRERNAVELRWPDADAHPQSTVLALRTILTLADEADRQLLTHALYRTYWVDNARLDEAAVQSVVARVFGARKPSMRSFDAAKDELRRNTDAYLSLGGFGVPGFVVNGQLVRCIECASACRVPHTPAVLGLGSVVYGRGRAQSCSAVGAPFALGAEMGRCVAQVDVLL